MTNLIATWADAVACKNKPVNKITLPHDAVASACASYRMYQENPIQRWADFASVKVQQQDQDQAEKLKQYYNKRFVQTTFDQLKSTTHRNLTEFKQKLYQLIIGQLVITDQEIGLLYRLPYLYHEDMALDQIAATTESAAVQGMAPVYHGGTFTLIKQVLKSRSAGEFKQYWFTRDHAPYAYMLPIKTDNILSHMFDKLTQQPIQGRVKVQCVPIRTGHAHLCYAIKSFEPSAYE